MKKEFQDFFNFCSYKNSYSASEILNLIFIGEIPNNIVSNYIEEGGGGIFEIYLIRSCYYGKISEKATARLDTLWQENRYDHSDIRKWFIEMNIKERLANEMTEKIFGKKFVSKDYVSAFSEN